MGFGYDFFFIFYEIVFYENIAIQPWHNNSQRAFLISANIILSFAVLLQSELRSATRRYVEAKYEQIKSLSLNRFFQLRWRVTYCIGCTQSYDVSRVMWRWVSYDIPLNEAILRLNSEDFFVVFSVLRYNFADLFIW